MSDNSCIVGLSRKIFHIQSGTQRRRVSGRYREMKSLTFLVSGVLLTTVDHDNGKTEVKEEKRRMR